MQEGRPRLRRWRLRFAARGCAALGSGEFAEADRRRWPTLTLRRSNSGSARKKLKLLRSLKRIGGDEPQLEICETRLEGVRARRAPTTWLGPFQRDKIPAHCISLTATFGERVFVRRRQTRLAWLFSWWHTTSIADNDGSIQYGLAGRRCAGLSGPRHELGVGTSSIARARRQRVQDSPHALTPGSRNT